MYKSNGDFKDIDRARYTAIYNAFENVGRIDTWSTLLAVIGHQNPELDLSIFEPESFNDGTESQLFNFDLRNRWLQNNFNLTIHPVTGELI